MRMCLSHLFLISNKFSVLLSRLGLSRAIALRKAAALEVGHRKAAFASVKVREPYILLGICDFLGYVISQEMLLPEKYNFLRKVSSW